MKNPLSRLILSFAVVSLYSTSAVGATLALYEFESVTTDNNFNTITQNDGSAPEFAPNAVAAGVSATNLSATGGGTTNGVRLGNNDLGVYASDVLLVGTNGTSLEDLADYFSIVITPGANSTIDFENLTLQGARGGGSARGFTVRSSVDGYATKLNGIDTEAIATQRPTLTNYTVDLSSSSFDAVVTPIEFRFYTYSTFKDNTVELDNISFNGEVVPEAASIVMLFAGLLGTSIVSLRKR